MRELERVCPNCGSPNPHEQSRCQRCNAVLTTLPMSQGANLPARIEGASVTALVLAATALVARTGLRLLVREILPRAAKSLEQKPAASQIVEPSSEGEPGYVIRGWRAWQVRSGTNHTSGSEHFEWRINRSDKPGAGRSR